MAKPLLTNNDFCRASKRLKCDVASVKAVAEVESRGAGFYANGFPTLLFERHVFRKYTDGKYNKSHPHLSGSQGNYGKAGQNQRNKFNEAYALDPIAAIKACSWGKFQVMGFNWKVAGYSGVVDFFNAMQRDEGEHLNAFIGFVIGNRLDDEIRHKDWAGFAYGYNGAGYKANKYDTAMARAYAKFAKEKIDCSGVSIPPPPVKSPDAQIDPALNTQIEETTIESSSGESASSTTITQGQNVVVEKEEPLATDEPKGFLKTLWVKITGAFGVSVTTDVAIEKAQQAQALGLSEKTWTFIFWAIFAGLAIYVLYHFMSMKVIPWCKWLLGRMRTHKLMDANSTATNQVIAVPADKLDEYEKQGWIVIRRNG